jgi:hypothetical protein
MEAEQLRDKTPISTPGWLMNLLFISGGFFLLAFVIGLFSNIFAPQPAVIDLPTTESKVEEIPEFSSQSEQTRKASLVALRNQCNLLADDAIADVENQLLEIRAMRWLVYAKAEAPKEKVTEFEFLTQKLSAMIGELERIASYGKLNPEPQYAEEFRKYLDATKEIKFALTKLPQHRHANVNAVDLIQRLNACHVAAMSHNNVLEFGASEALDPLGGSLP